MNVIEECLEVATTLITTSLIAMLIMYFLLKIYNNHKEHKV